MPLQLIEAQDGVIVKRGATEVHLAGQGAVDLVRALVTETASGTLSYSDLIETFPATLRADVEKVAQALLTRRMLVETGVEGPAPGAETRADVYYWDLERSRAVAESKLASFTITLVGVNAISRAIAERLREAGHSGATVVDFPAFRNLEEFGADERPQLDAWRGPERALDYVDWQDSFEPSDNHCLIVTSDSGGLSLMRDWNQFALDNELTFLPVVFQNLVGYIGPLVVPYETSCLECLLGRQNANRPLAGLARLAEAHAAAGQHVASLTGPIASMVGDLAALEIIKFCAALPGARVGVSLELRPQVPELAARTVLKVPRCAACSPMNRVSPVALDRVMLQEPSAEP